MDDNRKKRQRGENWNNEEKEILRELISHSKDVLENKSTNTNINVAKTKEWLNVTNKLNKLTGKNRKVGEIRLAWKRMKLTAKANLSLIHGQQTGGGRKSLSQSAENLQIMIAPLDFVIDENEYDSDVVNQTPDNFEVPDVDVVIVKQESDDAEEKQETTSQRYSLSEDKESENPTEIKKKTDSKINRTDQVQELADSDVDFKRRQIQIMEAEHALNVTISELQIKKLNLEISLLEKKLKDEN